jgi:alpha-mannosidase
LTLVRATICPVAITPDEDGAQCLRDHIYRYSVYPHKGNWNQAKVYKEARSHNVGLRAIETGRHDGDLPQELSFIEIEPDELVWSALKRSENISGYVLRFYNPTEAEVKGKVKFFKRLKSVEVTDMKEDKTIEKLKVENDNSVKLNVGAKKIVTLKFEPA